MVHLYEAENNKGLPYLLKEAQRRLFKELY